MKRLGHSRKISKRMIVHTKREDHLSRIGIVFILFSLIIWVVDKFTNSISIILSKIICDNHAIQAISGIVTDPSCRFRIDMHFTFFLLLTLVLGLVLYMLSRREIL